MTREITNYVLSITLFYSLSVSAQLVNSNAELNTAITNATAGATIVLADKIWTNVQISINKNGTMANPITIKAQTPGSVFFEGNSYVKMGGQYIYFEGVIFRNPSGLTTSTPVIDFRVSSTDCNNCKVTNVKIDAYNGTLSQQTEVFKWILLRGQYNEVSYCSFLNKHGVGSIINDNRSSTMANYHKIHHNYFAGRIPVGAVNDLNDQDAIRIGSSSTSLSDSYTEVYNNYFYDFSGEIEVISNKSGKNKYYNNTFEDYQGTLTLRHGNGGEVYNNFFFASGNALTGGIRVIGENHLIYNNYIEGVNSRKADNSLSNGTGGINVSNGKPSSALNEYYQVKNTTIVNNTFVNCDYGLRIGTKINSELTLAPENLVIANNIIYENTSRAIQVVTAPTGTSSKYEGNIKQNGTWDITTGTNGNNDVASGLLNSSTDFYRLIGGSAAIDAGLGSYLFLTEDITGGPRPVNFDAGAEEFGSNGTGKPYKQSDVGVAIGFGANTLSVSDASLATEDLMMYPVPIKDGYLNLSLKHQNLETVEVLDVLGRTVLKNYFESSKGIINLSRLTKGTYFIRVQGITKQIIK